MIKDTKNANIFCMENNIKKEKLIIIGSGPAGLTAAIYASRAELKPLIIEGQKPGGQLMGTSYVENWPGEKSILGPDLMIKMREHAEAFGSRFEAGNVTKVDLAKKPFKLWTSLDKEIHTDAIIIATGANPKKLNAAGEEKYWGKGVTTCAVCDGAFYRDQPVVIIGGGDTAMEDASFMTKFTNNITIIHILSEFTASKAMQKRVLDNPNIKIIYNSTVTEFKGNENKVKSVVVTNQTTKEQKELPAEAAFIAIGQNPGTDIFKDQLELNNYGYLILHDKTKTSVEGVFAAGDVADYRYRQAITSAGAGCMAALDAEKYLSSI